MTDDQFDIAMILMNPSLRGSPDYDPEADYPTSQELMEKYDDWMDDRYEEEKAKWNLVLMEHLMN